MPELSNPKWEAFAREYLVDFNGAQAAIRAGYSSNGAKQKGSELLGTDVIGERVRELIEARSWRTEITADRVLREWAVIAFSDISDFASWSGYKIEMRDSTEVEPEKLRAVESVSQGRDGMKIKMHSKLTALQKLAEHLGMRPGGPPSIPMPTTAMNSESPDTEKSEALDAAVRRLFDLINAGDMAAIRYFLNTQGRDRGFVETLPGAVNAVSLEAITKLLREFGVEAPVGTIIEKVMEIDQQLNTKR